MSGGVDSSVAAVRLIDAGHPVVGVTLRLFDDDASAIDSAQAVCSKLYIPHITLDFRDRFAETVVSTFIDEYRNGRTPNPCAICNRNMKCRALISIIQSGGGVGLATGHYARIRTLPEDDRRQLVRAADLTKDQTYFLSMVSPDDFAFLQFPMGDITKRDARRLAADRGLPSFDRPESNDVCFLPVGGLSDFLRQKIPSFSIPGPIRDSSGKAVGTHQGLAGYTIGQRRGIRVAAPEPYYVIGIDISENALIVGADADLTRKSLIARAPNWLSSEPPAFPLTCAARIRYRSPEAACVVRLLDDGRLAVDFNEPQRAVTPGQLVAFYDRVGGDVCLGGAWIDVVPNETV
jgi:tRNA-specific 2-thiouridylase